MKKRLYRVVLEFPLGVTHSVFIKAKNREAAEQIALKRYSSAIGINRSPLPLS